MAKQTSREIDKHIIGKWKLGVRPLEIAELVGVSKRTVERKIEKYNKGDMPYCDNIVENMSQFEKEEEEAIINLLKSEGYADIVRFSLKNITEARIIKEMDTKGLRGVTGLIGTLIDKRLKSYAIDLERENLKLKNKIASNIRHVTFVGEEQIIEYDNQLQENDTQDIS